MKIKYLIYQKLLDITQKSNFHFSPLVGKKCALAAINKARIKYGSEFRILYMIAYDLQCIAEFGYVTQNHRGFWYDYSEFI